MSIFTEVNQDNNENILKNEELMLKFLQPMHCDNLNKAKQFTELKGFFNSLIILSPTKTLSKASESLHIKNISLKNRRKI